MDGAAEREAHPRPQLGTPWVHSLPEDKPHQRISGGKAGCSSPQLVLLLTPRPFSSCTLNPNVKFQRETDGDVVKQKSKKKS